MHLLSLCLHWQSLPVMNISFVLNIIFLDSHYSYIFNLIFQVYANGIRNIDLHFIIQKLAAPVISVLLLSLCVPYIVASGITPLLGKCNGNADFIFGPYIQLRFTVELYGHHYIIKISNLYLLQFKWMICQVYPYLSNTSIASIYLLYFMFSLKTQ